ncbi:MAG: peptidase S41 [Tannerella sp.]|jgi:C-terminal processing protease CtpA/Prc|nr:peptidase S41 [Tannerella sp.]
MKKTYFIIISSVIILFACGSTKEKESFLNLDFEKVENGKPFGWYIYFQPNYSVYLDTKNVPSGKYAVVIEYRRDSAYLQPITLSLPCYDGERITLSGFIKTENVTDGYAGLWMRIDPIYGDKTIAFDNMQENGITGTTGWKKYEITLDMEPANTRQIVLGGLLEGKGKMWLDDLKVTVDGKDIQELKPYTPKPLPADLDQTFNTGSGISFPALNEQRINDLELLGRIWGFLKYHHPAIARGNYNWDYELFRFLPGYLKTEDIAQRDSLFLQWIDKLGDIPECKNCRATPDSAFLKPDLTWIEKSNMDTQLKEKLHYIYVNRSQGNHYYIQMEPSVSNPQFLHENDYKNSPYPDAGFRLLALYRYWNMINYFFPYKYLTDKNWNEVLPGYIARFITAKDELEYEWTALQLIGEVNDTHGNLWGGGDKIHSWRGILRSSATVEWIENKWVVTEAPISDAVITSTLQVGDIITAINGKDIKSITDSVKPYYPASNNAARMRDIGRDLLRSNDSIISLDCNSAGHSKKVVLSLSDNSNRRQKQEENLLLNNRCFKFLKNDIGYITLKTIRKEDIDEIKQVFRNTEGIVIDIRNYPGTYVPFLLGSWFVSGETPFVKFTEGNRNNPGEFIFRNRYDIPKPEETYQGKLVVLVNEETQSNAEFTAMAFQAGDNTTVIGSQTAGADGNVSEIVLPGGLKTMISGIGVYYPDGRETQRIGIVPDIEVKPTIKGIREGRDEVLEKAIEIIEKQ